MIDEEQEWVIESTVLLSVRTVMSNEERPSEDYARNIVEGGYYEQRTEDVDVRIDAIKRREEPTP